MTVLYLLLTRLYQKVLRRREDIPKEIKDIPNDYLKGDDGHKKYIGKLRDFKTLGNKVKSNALNYPLPLPRSPVSTKKLYRSRAREIRVLRVREQGL